MMEVAVVTGDDCNLETFAPSSSQITTSMRIHSFADRIFLLPPNQQCRSTEVDVLNLATVI